MIYLFDSEMHYKWKTVLNNLLNKKIEAYGLLKMQI